ncbi:MAG: 2-oxo acid dehydrogenase subunit E2 [Anaerolineae bacterium]
MANNNDDKGYSILPFPPIRQITLDMGRMHLRRHLMVGLLEFDVSAAREAIRKHKEATGEALSFSAFVVACLARAIADQPRVQAYRNWRNQLIVFSDVDVAMLIETEVNATAMPYVIREANRKTVHAIHEEIRAIQRARTPSQQQSQRLVRYAALLPAFVRALYYRAIMLSPQWIRQFAGTVAVTAVGMFAHGGGWGIGFLPFHTMLLTVGGIALKPALRDGQLVEREYLCLTLSIDHDVLDGAASARFTARFRELVESAYGLCSQQ